MAIATDLSSLNERVRQLLDSPVGARIVAEAEAATDAKELKRRHSLAAELASANDEFLPGLQRMEAAVQREEAKLAPKLLALLSIAPPSLVTQIQQLVCNSTLLDMAQRAEFVEVFRPRDLALHAVQTYRVRHAQRASRLEHGLRTPLPPPIAQALEDLQTMEETLRRNGVSSTTERVDDRPGHLPRLVGSSTFASVGARAVAIRGARQQLQDLALEALDPVALEQRIGDVLAAIPQVKLERVAA